MEITTSLNNSSLKTLIMIYAGFGAENSAIQMLSFCSLRPCLHVENDSRILHI